MERPKSDHFFWTPPFHFCSIPGDREAWRISAGTLAFPSIHQHPGRSNRGFSRAFLRTFPVFSPVFLAFHFHRRMFQNFAARLPHNRGLRGRSTQNTRDTPSRPQRGRQRPLTRWRLKGRSTTTPGYYSQLRKAATAAPIRQAMPAVQSMAKKGRGSGDGALD